METILAASPRDYVSGLDLPVSGPTFESARAMTFSDRREAVSVGAELTEFTDAVPAGVRHAIADSILLAQLAANKSHGDAQDIFRWYDKYIEVLQNLGWQVKDFEFLTQQVDDADAAMHETVIPVISAMLGPQAAAASILVSVLDGLDEMSADKPWLTVFDWTSQHAHGGKFQISYVDADAHGDPEIRLLCFGIRARQTITQVLFFKFSAQQAEVKKAEGRIGVSMDRLNAASELVAARVQPFIADYIAHIDI